MVALEIIVVAVVLFGLAAYVSGRFGAMSSAPPDEAADGLPDGTLHGTDLDGARFGLAFRGYRMAQVDSVLDRVRDQLLDQEAELETLRAELARERTFGPRNHPALPES